MYYLGQFRESVPLPLLYVGAGEEESMCGYFLLFQQSFPTGTAMLRGRQKCQKGQRPIAHFSAIFKQWNFHHSGAYMWANLSAQVHRINATHMTSYYLEGQQ